MTGVDQNLHDTIHERHEYDHGSMRWAAKFVSMVNWSSENQCLDLDFDQVSAVLPFQGTTNSNIAIGDSPEPESADSKEDEATVSSQGRGGAEATTNHISTDSKFDSEQVEKPASSPQHRHIRFSHGSRCTNLQRPHLPRHGHSHECLESAAKESASVARRRVRFQNHPMSRFSKGLYYRALEASWLRLLLWIIVIYFAVVAITAVLMYITVRNPRQPRLSHDLLLSLTLYDLSLIYSLALPCCKPKI